MKVSIDELRRNVAKLDAARRNARREAVAFLGRRISQQVSVRAPRDTGRFVRGYLLAFQKIGHFEGSMPALQHSKYIEQAIKILVDQHKFWSNAAASNRKTLLERYPNGPQRGRMAGYKAVRKRLEKSQDLAMRAQQELSKFRSAPYGIIMSPLRWEFTPEGRRLITVRPNPYGGDGTIIEGDTSTKARILTKEPHAEFVERERSTLPVALFNATRGTIFEKAGKTYVKGIKNVAQVQGAARERFLAGN